MKEEFFEEKIKVNSTWSKIVLMLTVFNFICSILLLDSTILTIMFIFITLMCAIVYEYFECKAKFYKKALYYYRRRIYGRAIIIKRA